MPVCLAMGEAAGMAAARAAIFHSGKVREVGVPELRASLQKAGGPIFPPPPDEKPHGRVNG